MFVWICRKQILFKLWQHILEATWFYKLNSNPFKTFAIVRIRRWLRGWNYISSFNSLNTFCNLTKLISVPIVCVRLQLQRAAINLLYYWNQLRVFNAHSHVLYHLSACNGYHCNKILYFHKPITIKYTLYAPSNIYRMIYGTITMPTN